MSDSESRRLPLYTNTIVAEPMESGRGQPHSKTCRVDEAPRLARQRLGVRLSSAALLGTCVLVNLAFAVYAAPRKEVSPVSLGADGKLVYQPDPQGNRIPDFS